MGRIKEGPADRDMFGARGAKGLERPLQYAAAGWAVEYSSAGSLIHTAPILSSPFLMSLLHGDRLPPKLPLEGSRSVYHAGPPSNSFGRS